MATSKYNFGALGKLAVSSAPKAPRRVANSDPAAGRGGGYSGAPNVATGSGASPMSKKAAPSSTPSGPVYLGSSVNHTGNVRDGLTFRQYTDAAHPGMVIHEYTINGERHRIAVPKSQMRHF